MKQRKTMATVTITIEKKEVSTTLVQELMQRDKHIKLKLYACPIARGPQLIKERS